MADMHNGNIKLSGHRLKTIREHKNVSQEELSKVLECGIEELRQKENDFMECTPERLSTIKRFFDIEGMPLADGEAVVFKEHLRFWRDLMRNQKSDEAIELQKKISPITLFPLEPELSLMYNLLEIANLLSEGHLDAAEGKLASYEKIFENTEKMDSENLYYYYRNMGSMKSLLGRCDEALEFYLKALELGEGKGALLKDDAAIYYNIAASYSDLHLPHQTIAFLGKVYESHHSSKMEKYRLHLDITLAINYIRINGIQEAKKLLNKCLLRVEYSSNRLAIGVVLHNCGLLCKVSKEWEQAIYYFDKASTYFQEGSGFCLENLYHKARCLLYMGKHAETGRVFEQAKTYNLDSTENWKYLILFKSLLLLVELNESTEDCEERVFDHIGVVTIPYLINIYEYSKALDYCEVLSKHYGKTEDLIKSVAVYRNANIIYEKMLRHGGN